MQTKKLRQKKHPKEMYFLAMTEMAQRFAFWGVGNLLVLYLVKFYDFGGAKATHFYGAFTGIAFVLPVLGGYLADRWNYKSPVIWGIILTSLGCFLLATTEFTFLFPALACLSIGGAIFTPSIYTLLGHIYHDKHAIRESGFSIYYSSVNIGVFLAMIILGYVMHHYGWRLVFIIAACVQLLGLLSFIPIMKFMKTNKVKHHVFFKDKHKPKYPLHRHEKRRLFVIATLSIVSILFWLPYNQTASSITLFTLKYVDHTVFGYTLPVPWFISLESLFLVIFALPLASLYLFLRKVRSNPNPIMKTAFSMIFMGLCFLILVRAAGSMNGPDSVNSIYLVFSFALMAIAELLIAPIGLSLITNLSPRRYTALLVGCWYMCIGIGFYSGGYIAGLITTMKASSFFEIFVVISFITAFVLAIFAKKLNKMRHVEILEKK